MHPNRHFTDRKRGHYIIHVNPNRLPIPADFQSSLENIEARTASEVDDRFALAQVGDREGVAAAEA